jgi:aspartate aminotransferase
MSRALSGRVAYQAPVGTLAFASAAREMEARGVPVVRLDIGEPHLATPPHIVEAAIAAMHDGQTKYVDPQGLPELRAAVASHVQARGVPAGVERVAIGSGVKPLLLYTMLALVGPGDEVLVPDPGYPGYAASARLAGAEVRTYPMTHDARGWTVDVDEVASAITPATRLLVLNSPHNPTGAVIDACTLTRLAELAERHALWIVSDEIYGLLTYGDELAPSIASLPGMSERTVVLDGFSKAYAMTGWRLGYAVLPAGLVGAFRALLGDASTCTPAFVQRAGIAALTGPQDVIGEMRTQYGRRRDELLACLGAIPGVSVSRSPGALYVLPDLGEIMAGRGVSASSELATELLADFGLATVAGSVFGARSAQCVRLSFGVAEQDIYRATRQLTAWARACGGCGTPRRLRLSGCLAIRRSPLRGQFDHCPGAGEQRAVRNAPPRDPRPGETSFEALSSSTERHIASEGIRRLPARATRPRPAPPSRARTARQRRR